MPVDVDNRLHRVLLIGWFWMATRHGLPLAFMPADERAPTETR